MPSRSFSGAAASAVILFATSLSACRGTDQPMAPDDAEALVAAAPTLSLHEAVGALALGEEEAAALRPVTEELHRSMLATHRMLREMEGLEGEERAAAHAVLQTEMAELRERHAALAERLTAEQRETFMDHVHRQMEEHGRPAGNAHGIHATGHAAPSGR